jgi:hypothetical protein
MTYSDLQRTFRNWLQQYLRLQAVSGQVMLRDGVILLILLFAANWVIAYDDLGWIERHPSPYFLLPILMGCRYGFPAGAGSGTAAMIVMALAHGYIKEIALPTVFADHLYLFFCLPLSGGICGEIQEFFALRIGQQTRLLDHIQKRTQRLDEENYLLRAAKQEVENTLVTLNAEVSTLDFEIRRLYESLDEEIFSNLLNLLSRWARIQQAAVYHYQEGQILRRLAFIGAPGEFPLEMPEGKNRLVVLALEKKTIVTLAHLWNPFFVPTTDYLMAVPLVARQEHVMAVLVVARMPFTTLNRRTIHSINLICRWSARLVAERKEARGDLRFTGRSAALHIRDRSQLKNSLDLGYESLREWQLPSSLLAFHLPGDSISQQELLEETLMPAIRGEDLPASLGLSRAHLAVFLPLTGEREAAICRDQLLRECEDKLSSIEARIYLLDDYPDTTALMRVVETTILR